MNWNEYDELYNAPQREAEEKLERERQAEKRDDQERYSE